MSGALADGSMIRAEHRLVRFRLVGWLLIALSQLGALANVAWRYATPALDMLGRALGIVGVAIVAFGFERFVELHHAHPLRDRR